MVRYFYAWTPLVILTAVFVLALPWLGLIALMVVALVALGALTWAVVFVPYMLSRAIGRRWHAGSGASPWTALALSPAGRHIDSGWQGAPAHPAAALSVGRTEPVVHISLEGGNR